MCWMTGAPPEGCFSETLTSEQFAIVAALNVVSLVYFAHFFFWLNKGESNTRARY